MDRGTRRGHTDCPELRDPHTPPSRQPQGGASVPHPPPTRPPESSVPKPLTGLKHRQPRTPGKLSGPHGPAVHANPAGNSRCLLSAPWPGACPAYLGTCGSSHALRNPTGVAVFLQKGKQGLDTKLNLPAAMHWSAQGERGPEATRAEGAGVREASGVSRGMVKGRSGILCPAGDGDTETAVSTHTHTHTSGRVHTPDTRPAGGPGAPECPPSSATLGWGRAVPGTEPWVWVQNPLEPALSSTGRGRAGPPQKPPPPRHQMP